MPSQETVHVSPMEVTPTVTLFFYFILRRFPLTFDFSQWFVGQRDSGYSVVSSIRRWPDTAPAKALRGRWN